MMPKERVRVTKDGRVFSLETGEEFFRTDEIVTLEEVIASGLPVFVDEKGRPLDGRLNGRKRRRV